MCGEVVAEWSEHGGGELDDPSSNSARTWPFFQAIVKRLKKPTFFFFYII